MVTYVRYARTMQTRILYGAVDGSNRKIFEPIAELTYEVLTMRHQNYPVEGHSCIPLQRWEITTFGDEDTSSTTTSAIDKNFW